MADKLNGDAIVVNTVQGNRIQNGTITSSQLDPAIAAVVSVPAHPKISSLDYPGDDTAANTGGGDTVIIRGAGFKNNVAVYINGNAVPSVTYNNANAVTITTAAQSSGSYLVYLINTDDGGTAILVPGIQYSGLPTWVTESPLTGQSATAAWNISLSATSDSAVSYELQAGSSLPAGITLSANGLISGTLSSPPATDTTYNFTVVAIDAELQDTPKAFSVSVTVAVDTKFQYTTLLLQADGTEGGNNHAFVDSSDNAFTITRNGNASQGSFSPFSPTGWSAYFDGNLDYLSGFTQQNLSDFTCECWFYRGEDVSGYHIIFGGPSSSGAGNCQLFANNSGAIGVTLNSTAVVSATGTAVAKNQWNHIAYVRSSSTLSVFVNGIRIATVSNSTQLQVAYIGYLGGQAGGSYEVRGYLSDVRIANTAIYDPSLTTLTVPTAPLTAVSGTQLLTCQSNRFIDNSDNALTITRNGNASVQAFSPYATTTAYSPATHGGSAYFDGSGDYLTLSGNPTLTTNFTIEFWFYMPSWGDRVFLSQGGGAGSFSTTDGVAFQIYSTSSTFWVQWSNGAGSFDTLSAATSGIATNAWHHVAIGNDGTTTRLWIDGVSVDSDTGTPTWGYPTTRSTYIGYISYASAYVGLGYMAGVRMVTSDVYDASQTTITVPTAPPSNIANTALLCSFSNANIYDSAAGNVLETVGDAKVNTSITKFGAGSMAFDGTGDYLKPSALTDLNFGTGDFTIEFWLYLNTVAVQQWFVAWTGPNTNTIYMNSGTIRWYANNGLRITGAALSASQWYHIALVRSAGNTKLFINGVQSGATYADTNSYVPTAFTIGATTTGTAPLNGYIDDLRITKGYARYIYSFTPPTKAFSAKGGTETLTADPYFPYTTLLLPGNGTNNQNNHTFLDSSDNNFTITRNGNATQGTFSPFSQTGWSNYFDGTGDYLSGIGAVSDFNFMHDSSALWTFECWLYTTSTSNQYLLDNSNGTTSQIGVYLGIESSNLLFTITRGSTGTWVATGTSTSTVPINQWVHLAITYDQSLGSDNGKFYINGVASGTATKTANAPSASNASNAMRIGAYASGSGPFLGYISNLRITNSIVYSEAFTPPTSILTNIANTSLLTCQSNRFIDNSDNAFAITRNGDVSVQAFSPFAPTASYSAATYGGSGYFDGTSDDLSFSNVELGSGDFTIEGWMYPNVVNVTYQYLLSGPTGPPTTLQILLNNSTFYLWNVLSHQTAVVPKQWHHFAVVRNSNVTRLYLNGVQSTSSSNYTGAITANNIGFTNFNGYLSDIRLVSGNAVYTSSFTPPTAPLTAIANTEFLCNFTNAGITDATAKNVLETVGDAKISTVQSKFGGSSMYFDGTLDKVATYTYNPQLSMGTGDFTIEGWVYRADTNIRGVVNITATAFAGGGLPSDLGLAVGSNSGSVWRIYANNTGYDSVATWSINTWYHFALVRYSGTTNLYINGSSVISQADTTDYAGGFICVGGFYNDTYLMNGYIDDLRITKGIARYTQNFTLDLPTSAFLTK